MSTDNNSPIGEQSETFYKASGILIWQKTHFPRYRRNVYPKAQVHNRGPLRLQLVSIQMNFHSPTRTAFSDSDMIW
jgi:hypothetical protein